MPRVVECSDCGRKLHLADALVAGQAVRCPTCGATFPAPRPDAGEEVERRTESERLPSFPAARVRELSVDDVEPASGRVRGLPPPPRPLRAVPVPVPEASIEEAAASRNCPSCGQHVHQEASRCRFCGEALSNEDDRPWQSRRAGRVRRDCEPHRGSLILMLGSLSLLGLTFPPAGLALGIAAWLMGLSDLRQMRDCTMDPEGRALTRSGMNCGMIGTILNGIIVLGCGGLFLLHLLASY
jgi:predicted RNA-binding Zn-ribbon protein involved in translation (DUF1610 family)